MVWEMICVQIFNEKIYFLSKTTAFISLINQHSRFLINIPPLFHPPKNRFSRLAVGDAHCKYLMHLKYLKPLAAIYRELEVEKVAPERYFHSTVVQLGKTLFLRYTDKSICFINTLTRFLQINVLWSLQSSSKWSFFTCKHLKTNFNECKNRRKQQQARYMHNWMCYRTQRAACKRYLQPIHLPLI